MDWLLAAIFVVGFVALIGFFWTKERGYGRFNTSTLLLLLVVVISALLYAASKLDGQVLANIFFAVIGFAGGLFTGRKTEAPGSSPKGNAPSTGDRP